MVNRLLTALSIGICLLFITAQTQPAFAQTRKQNSGYVQIVKKLIITKGSVTTSVEVKGKQTQQIPKATPTIYIKPPITQTVAKSPTIIESNKPSTVPTSKVTKSTPAEKPKTVEPTKETPVSAAPAVPAPASDAMSFIMTGINNYRSSQGLSSVQTSNETCSFAATRAVEIVSNFSHDGFQNRIDSKTLPYKTWSGITENIAMTSNYKDVVNMWINSPGHAANMRADTPFVCVRQNGNYFAYVGMKP
jgi:uncharacterized protein YkwD